MVELIVNNNVVDLPLKGGEIQYNKQVSDIFDLSKVSSSYTNSFVAPKTTQNTKTLEGLGIPGDNSTIPYSKSTAVLVKDGITLINKGWLNISETSDNYKLSIIDGMIDFFKAIENKTLGVDLDLTNFKHTKDLPTVLASKNNPYYTYIFSDYGGNNVGRIPFNPSKRILIDYQVPSFSMLKLFDLIFTTFGFTWESQRMLDFLTELWITYPTPPAYVETPASLIATLNKGFYKSNIFGVINGKYFISNEQQWTTSTITEGTLINNNRLKIAQSSGYKLLLKVEAYQTQTIKSRVPLPPLPFSGNNDNFTYIIEDLYKPAYVDVYRNGNIILTFETDPYTFIEKELTIYLNENDIISYMVYSNGIQNLQSNQTGVLKNIAHNSTKFEIKKVNQGEVTPDNAFKNFKITDFFKEILYRTGLIPTIKDKHITFKHVSETVNFSNADNWSDKFINRKKETYIKNSYAQRNLFKMKYNDEQTPFNDGVLLVNNANIEDEKTLAQSVFYSPERENGELFKLNSAVIEVPILKMYKSEVKKVDEDIETTYKALDSHFYLLRKKNIVADLGLISYEIPAEELVSDWNFAAIENTLLGQLVDINFSEYNKIFQNFRCHEIELRLSLLDVLGIDFSKPIFFEKESAYYILNKLSFKEGETTVGEFIKINK